MHNGHFHEVSCGIQDFKRQPEAVRRTHTHHHSGPHEGGAQAVLDFSHPPTRDFLGCKASKDQTSFTANGDKQDLTLVRTTQGLGKFEGGVGFSRRKGKKAKRKKGKTRAHKREEQKEQKKKEHCFAAPCRPQSKSLALILRTKRNDFPVGAAYAQPPQPPIYIYI